MTEQGSDQTRDIMQFWRDWLTETERQLNAFLNESMATETFSRSMGGYLEVSAAVQRMMADGMQRYLTFWNLPSRRDVIALGESLRNIEERLARIEEMLQLAGVPAEHDGRMAEPRPEPARTRRPVNFPAPRREDLDVWKIPRELRR